MNRQGSTIEKTGRSMGNRTLALCCLSMLTFVGCDSQGRSGDVPPCFSFPKLANLADVDSDNATYGKECVIIDGVVSPSSQAASVREEDGYNVHVFTIAAWREPNGPVIEREIVVLRPVPSDHDWESEFPACSVHRMSVLLSEEKTRAVFNESLRLPKPDQELLAVADRLQQPVLLRTKRFGELVLDRSYNWFEGEAKWNGEMIGVTFPADEEGSIGDSLETAELLWSHQREWKQRIDNFAVQELLELKNGMWLEEGEAKLSAKAFISRMTLESVTISPGGAFEFWYGDGDLFWGHSIQIDGNVKDGPAHANIQG